METATILLTVAALWAVAAATPGPNLFLVAGHAMAGGRALAAVVGVAAGTAVWGAAGFLGVTVLFEAAPWLFAALKVAGGAYLVFLGLRLFLAGSAPAEVDGAADGPGRAFLLGLLTNLSNPKTTAFVVSLFAATMPADAPAWLGAAAVAVMAGVSLLWYGTTALLFAKPGPRGFYLRHTRAVDRLAGGVFVAFGVRLMAGEVMEGGR